MSILDHDWFPRPLPPQTELGERSWLHSSYAFHHSCGTVRIGADTGIYSGTQFELGPDAEVEIGDFCTIVGALIATNGRVSIGDHTFIAGEVVLADTPFALPPVEGRFSGRLSTAPRGGSPDIVVGAGAWIGTRAILLAGARIGRDAIVGAGAVVTGEVPSGATAVGNPMRVVSH
ncbi:MAG: acyltransferase [Candidatus Dormibacteraeota bacterium]|nr:acyltransferase [Candidatus Dormibacteraeota bacterium]